MNILDYWIILGLITLAVGTVMYVLDDFLTKIIMRRLDND